MDFIRINDKREQKEFSGISFSGYKKSQVIKEFIESVLYNKIEDACYWCFELMFAGHMLDIWEIILKIMSNHIHIGNPKLPIYIALRSNEFKQIMNNNMICNEIDMRNNKSIRKIFLEIVVILCYSEKKNTITPIKLNDDALNISEFGRLLIATSTTFSKPFFKVNDPKEIYIPINEFAYHISEKSLMSHKASYWVEWLYYFDSICKKKKSPIYCQKRNYINDPKFENDILWILWDSILYESNKRNEIIQRIVRSLLSLYCLRMTKGTIKKRKHLFYFAINILCECNYFDIHITQCDNLETIVKKTNHLVNKIKQNEIIAKEEIPLLHMSINRHTIQ